MFRASTQALIRGDPSSIGDCSKERLLPLVGHVDTFNKQQVGTALVYLTSSTVRAIYPTKIILRRINTEIIER